MMLYLRRTPKMGRGVFTKERIARATLVQENPYLTLPNPTGLLANYVFFYDRHKTALALGLISMMNHSATPNVRIEIHSDMIRAYATKTIERRRQLFINYGYDPCLCKD